MHWCGNHRDAARVPVTPSYLSDGYDERNLSVVLFVTKTPCQMRQWRICQLPESEVMIGRGILLLLLGIPIPVIVLLYVFHVI